MSLCPCQSGRTYDECCQPVHNDHARALVPEQLMRARFSAHVLGMVDFVVNTYHPDNHAEAERDGIAQSVHLDWKRLEVVSAPAPPDSSDTGYVEFKAYMAENGVEHCMHERSRFVKTGGLWYYVDGTFPEPKAEKTGRNDPCVCGSGKKFKKCCGR